MHVHEGAVREGTVARIAVEFVEDRFRARSGNPKDGSLSRVLTASAAPEVSSAGGGTVERAAGIDEPGSRIGTVRTSAAEAMQYGLRARRIDLVDGAPVDVAAFIRRPVQRAVHVDETGIGIFAVAVSVTRPLEAV